MFIKIPTELYSVFCIAGHKNGAKKLSPRPGAILYTGMAYSYADHSGVYVGNGEVELQGDGNIKKVSLREFLDTPLQGRPETLQTLAVNALEMAGKPGLAMALHAAPLEAFTSECGKVYVSCHNGRAVGSAQVAQRALDMVGSSRNYNFILDNCHQFSSGCLTGDFENSDNFLWMLKATAQKTIGADEWHVWDR